MSIINFFRKRLSDTEPPHTLNVSECEVGHFDYMEYFFKARNQDDLTTTIHNQLSSLSNEELVALAIDVLSVTLNYLRSSAEQEEWNPIIEKERFYRAMIWHLSDAVHNLPAHLTVERAHIDLIHYLNEYFVFAECLEGLDKRLGLLDYRASFLITFRRDIRNSL